MLKWNSDKDSDNYCLRAACVEKLNLNIIGIAESHLTKGQKIELEGYSWYGNNRQLLHVNARNGSGGVGFFFFFYQK